MFAKGKSEFIPFIVTILGIVFTDLLMGIAMGMVVAIFHILWKNYQMPYHFDPERHIQGETVRIELAENVSFLNKVSIMKTLHQLPEGTRVHLDGTRARSIHPDIIEIIDDFREKAAERNIELHLKGVSSDPTQDPVKRLGEHLVRNGGQPTQEAKMV
jgi:MFS superfamily sulfate permease-like transporter